MVAGAVGHTGTRVLGFIITTGFWVVFTVSVVVFTVVSIVVVAFVVVGVSVAEIKRKSISYLGYCTSSFEGLG